MLFFFFIFNLLDNAQIQYMCYLRSTYMKLILRKSRNEHITDIIHGKLEYMVLLTEMNE